MKRKQQIKLYGYFSIFSYILAATTLNHAVFIIYLGQPFLNAAIFGIAGAILMLVGDYVFNYKFLINFQIKEEWQDK